MVIILQLEINLSGETVSPNRFIFQYIKSLSNINKLKTFIVPNLTDFIKFLDNNVILIIYRGGNIHGLYCYLEIIGSSTTLTTSGHRFHHFGPSSFTNNDTSTLHPFITALHVWQKTIC